MIEKRQTDTRVIEYICMYMRDNRHILKSNFYVRPCRKFPFTFNLKINKNPYGCYRIL